MWEPQEAWVPGDHFKVHLVHLGPETFPFFPFWYWLREEHSRCLQHEEDAQNTTSQHFTAPTILEYSFYTLSKKAVLVSRLCRYGRSPARPSTWEAHCPGRVECHSWGEGVGDRTELSISGRIRDLACSGGERKHPEMACVSPPAWLRSFSPPPLPSATQPGPGVLLEHAVWT